jgi:hypothetical protein
MDSHTIQNLKGQLEVEFATASIYIYVCIYINIPKSWGGVGFKALHY